MMPGSQSDFRARRSLTYLFRNPRRAEGKSSFSKTSATGTPSTKERKIQTGGKLCCGQYSLFCSCCGCSASLAPTRGWIHSHPARARDRYPGDQPRFRPTRDLTRIHETCWHHRLLLIIAASSRSPTADIPASPQERCGNIGPVEIDKHEEHRVPLAPIVGGLCIAGGIVRLRRQPANH